MKGKCGGGVVVGGDTEFRSREVNEGAGETDPLSPAEMLTLSGVTLPTRCCWQLILVELLSAKLLFDSESSLFVADVGEKRKGLVSAFSVMPHSCDRMKSMPKLSFLLSMMN